MTKASAISGRVAWERPVTGDVLGIDADKHVLDWGSSNFHIQVTKHRAF